MRLIFIRHAEPDYSIDSLTEKGWREAKLLAERTKRWKVDEFYCSPLGRAKDTASFTLKECGREAVTCDWMREFDACVVDPETGKNRLSWDLKPAYWTKEPDLLNIDRFLETDLMKSGPVAETYQKVCDGLDGILAKHGYHREGRLYRTKQHNEDTVVLFCHMGVTFYMLSHLLSISPVCLNHTMFLPPSSVTVVSTEEVEQKQAQIMWQTRLDARMSMKPAIVVNHNTGERELFVQDEGNTIYLINDVGRILWKLPIEGRINSEVYQVDMFKNGKLQYLFSTPSHLYLIDRNGNYLPRFPLAFKSPCKQGISVADYENNKNYRVFAPGVDHHVYLYELSGNFVKGWDVPKSDNDIVSKIYHFRVDGKDYLVYADQYRLYILDRKGKERVKVSTLLNLSGNTPLYLTRQDGQMKIAFSDVNGEIVLVDFRGRVERVKGEKMVGGGILNVEDINGDGQDEFVYSRKDMLCVYDVQGKLLLEKCWENAELSFPYVYRFSARDSRIGVMDGKGERLFLLDMKDVSKGFPIRGNSPFSITFGDKGNAGFYLFAGSDGTHLLKYRVLR